MVTLYAFILFGQLCTLIISPYGQFTLYKGPVCEHQHKYIMHLSFQAAIGGEGKVDWDEILDKNLLGGSIPEEARVLADVAYRCINRSPRKRPWISEVTQAISRLRQRQMTLPRSETRTVLRRIEYQHVELSDLAGMKELTPVGA